MTINLQIPTSWAALTTEQLREVVELASTGLRREEYLLVLFCHFAGLKMIASKDQSDEKTVVRTKFKYGDTVFTLEDWQVSDFCGRLAFAFDEPIPMDVAWPFLWNRYLLDTAFGKWFHADAMMLRFSMDGEIGHVISAMEDLGDPHPNLQNDQPSLVLMLRWYDLFKDWLQERYPLVFQKAEPGSEGPASPVETRQNIMLMLNNNRPQDNEAIEQSNLHDVLAALQHKIEEAKHIEEQMSKYK